MNRVHTDAWREGVYIEISYRLHTFNPWPVMREALPFQFDPSRREDSGGQNFHSVKAEAYERLL